VKRPARGSVHERFRSVLVGIALRELAKNAKSARVEWIITQRQLCPRTYLSYSLRISFGGRGRVGLGLIAFELGLG
jgi:hypothetical protein